MFMRPGIHVIDDIVVLVRSSDGHVWYLPGYARTIVRASRAHQWERIVILMLNEERRIRFEGLRSRRLSRTTREEERRGEREASIAPTSYKVGGTHPQHERALTI